MKYGFRMDGRAMSVPAGMALGAGTGLGWTVLWSAVAGKLLDAQVLEPERLGWCALGVLLTASALASVLAWKRVKHRKLAVMLGAGGSYYLGLLLVNILCFGGRFSGMGVTALAVLGGSGGGYLLSSGRKSAGKGGIYGKHVGKLYKLTTGK